MNRKLTAKIQKINPTYAVSAKVFSDAFIIEPENQTLLMKRGVLYAVYSVSSSAELQTPVVSKLVHDVLHDSYYQSENISPTQSLEKSISEVKDRLAKMSPGEFNLIAGVLWGNVIYVVQFGNNACFLVRENQIRNISMVMEGNFGATSGVIKDEEVVILSTGSFASVYTPEKLLTSSITTEDLPADAAALILKFEVDTSFSDNEVIDFGVSEKIKPAKKPFMHAGVPALPKINLPKVDFKLKLSPLKIVLICAVLLVVSIAFKLGNGEKTQSYTEDQNLNNPGSGESVQTSSNTREPGYDANTKTLFVNSPVFYDIKIADASAEPTSILVTDSYVAAGDNQNGKLYVSDISTPKFTAGNTTFSGIKNLHALDNAIAFTDSEGFKAYNPANSSVTQNYAGTDLGVSYPYLDFVYAVSGDTILKYTKSSNQLTSSIWGQNPEFSGAKDMAISVSIFVLKSDGEIVSYTTGTKDSWSVTGLDAPFVDPVQIYTNVDISGIYIADRGNNRIVVLDKRTGAFNRQIKNINNDNWSDVRDLAVSKDEKTLYLLNGSKVYEVKLDATL